MEFIDVDYRVDWDGDDTYRVVFQVTARLKNETEETTGYTADHTFDDEDEAMQFAEGFVEELTGG